jgi:HEPN domain-containing protein
MQPEEAKAALVNQWTERAEKDFSLAAHLVSEGCVFCEAIAFNCQQAVEKHLKALLTAHQIGFRKTHNLGDLLDLLQGADPELASALSGVTSLNPYGVEYRYPSDFPDLMPADALEAFRLAEGARTLLLAALQPWRTHR